jgi:hypothetical protein
MLQLFTLPGLTLLVVSADGEGTSRWDWRFAESRDWLHIARMHWRFILVRQRNFLRALCQCRFGDGKRYELKHARRLGLFICSFYFNHFIIYFSFILFCTSGQDYFFMSERHSLLFLSV